MLLNRRDVGQSIHDIATDIYIYSFNNSKTSHERLKLLKNNESTSNLNESICVQNYTVSFQKIKYEKFLHGTSWRSWRSTITHLKKITSNSKVILITI